MKKIITILLSLAAMGYAQTAKGKQLQDNIGQSLFLFGSAPNGIPSPDALVNLDTAEIDTSYYWYELVDKPINAIADTVGQVHFRCKDSTGTDSMGVRINWDGNSRADGKGLWALMDSVTLLGASASSYVNGTPTAVVNSLGYMAIRFRIKNIKVSAVGLKSTCRDVVLNRRKRNVVTSY